MLNWGLGVFVILHGVTHAFWPSYGTTESWLLGHARALSAVLWVAATALFAVAGRRGAVAERRALGGGDAPLRRHRAGSHPQAVLVAPARRRRGGRVAGAAGAVRAAGAGRRLRDRRRRSRCAAVGALAPVPGRRRLRAGS